MSLSTSDYEGKLIIGFEFYPLTKTKDSISKETLEGLTKRYKIFREIVRKELSTRDENYVKLPGNENDIRKESWDEITWTQDDYNDLINCIALIREDAEDDKYKYGTAGNIFLPTDGPNKVKDSEIVLGLNFITTTAGSYVTPQFFADNCRNSCVGSCYIQCSGYCTKSCGGNCGGDCISSCSESCIYGCDGTCVYDCITLVSGAVPTNCNNNCVGSCYSAAHSECISCSNSCVGGCTGSCKDQCGYGCEHSCSSCEGSCYRTCLNSCSNSCSDNCGKSCSSYCYGDCKGMTTTMDAWAEGYIFSRPEE